MAFRRSLQLVTSIALSSLVLAGCGGSGGDSLKRVPPAGSTTVKSKSGEVEVTQAPMTVATDFFDRDSDQDKSWAEVHNQSANTHWRLTCVPRFEFDILDKRVEQKKVTVKLKIKSVHIDLGAPIIIYLPKFAKPDVVAHEDGHVKIARKIYETKAANAALRSGESVIGIEFSGTDTTLEEACQSALHRAAQAIGRDFRGDTLYLLNRLSAFYDHFAPQHPEAKYVDGCIEGAFKAEQMYEDGKLPLGMMKEVKLKMDKSDTEVTNKQTGKSTKSIQRAGKAND